MGRSRYGGFRKKRWKFRSETENSIADNIWGVIKSESSNQTTAPDTIQDFSYTDAQGIWNLKSTTLFPKVESTATFPWSGESTNLGSTTRSYTSGFPLNISTSWSGSADFTAAIDFPNGISGSDTGIILELGGSSTGTIIVMESGTIYLGSDGHSGDTTFNTSFTPYVDQQGALYFTVNHGVTDGEQLYWWDGSTMTELITTTMSADGAGGDNTGVGGQASQSWNISTTNDQGTFTGTIDGYREWNGTAFDFSTV